MQRAVNDPIAQRCLFVKNLDFNISGSDLYDLFGKYGAIRQVRMGTDAGELKTKGTAYVVFESPDDAQDAAKHLNGFHLSGRYIVVLFHHPTRQAAAVVAKQELRAREEAVIMEKRRLGMQD